jgi:hypothetical protein
MIRVVPARRPTFALEQAALVGASVAAAPVAVPPAAPAGPASASAMTALRAAGPPPTGPLPAAAVAPRVTVPSNPDGYDRLRLRDGRLVRGRVELVRVSAVVFRDADTGLRYEYPKADVDAVVTEFGSVVRFSPEDRPGAGAPGAVASGAGAAERAAARLVRRGVGGRYQVTFSVVSVNGSPSASAGGRRRRGRTGPA